MASSQSDQRRQVPCSLSHTGFDLTAVSPQVVLDKQRQEMLSEFGRQREAMIKVLTPSSHVYL